MFRKFKNIFTIISNKSKFSDGSTLRALHRFALRYESEKGYVDIGFEVALKPKIDRLIHVDSINSWNANFDLPISEEDKHDILEKVKKYCEEKRFSYVEVP